MELTKEQIEEDIAYYQARLARIQDNLNVLPDNLKGRKLHATRQRLQAEVKHVRGLIRLASEALAELGQAGTII